MTMICSCVLLFEPEVDPDSLFITNGASSGIDLIAHAFTKPGDVGECKTCQTAASDICR
jgi:DNA-binding transcriptional MocR family regulator